MLVITIEAVAGEAKPQLVTVLAVKLTIVVPPLTVKAGVKPVKVLVPIEEPLPVLAVIEMP